MNYDQVRYFVVGYMHCYYENVGHKPQDYTAFTQDTVSKVWCYLSKGGSIHGGFHDQQAACAIEASMLFTTIALKRSVSCTSGRKDIA